MSLSQKPHAMVMSNANRAGDTAAWQRGGLRMRLVANM
jgi:hypothetical protein